ncbi:MAG TPA: iron chelate uptake ABC transporter family permease subunit [Acidimicrobiales bacterium]|nr:iron chelate uptake ABC transporter family permease subunit [Acidimicrobiales bacterium]
MTASTFPAAPPPVAEPRTRTLGAVSIHLHAGLLTVRLWGISWRTSVRAVGVSLVLAAVVVVGMAWSVSVGDFPIPIGDVVKEISGIGGTTDSDFIIHTLRLPRVLTGILVGFAFGVSGQIFQRMVRNPLASPDILGLSSGAALGAVFSIVILESGTISATGAALIGSVCTVIAIYLLAIKQGISSYRLVLVGIGITALLDAGVEYLLTRAELNDAHRATVWLTGSLNGRGWEFVRPLTLALAILVPVAMACTRNLRVLELGDDTASALGVSLRRSKLGLTLSGAGLAAAATAAAGPVGFVALVAPQIARRLVGERAVGIVPAGLVGAAVMVFADLIARRVFSPTELPVGVITAVVGAPYLLWLLARANKIGTGG